MKSYLKGLGLSALLAIGANSASAAVISYAGYSWDDSTDRVISGGLEWLRWNGTRGMSIDSAVATYGADGWMVASNTQMAALFNSFGFGASSTWDANENTTQSTYNNDGANESAADPEKNFVRLFGNTDPDYPGTTNSPDPLEISRAWFGTDPDGDGYFNVAQVYDDFVLQNQSATLSGAVQLTSDGYLPTLAIGTYGVALVRATNSGAIPVSPIFPLLTIGAVAMGMLRATARQPQRR